MNFDQLFTLIIGGKSAAPTLQLDTFQIACKSDNSMYN